MALASRRSPFGSQAPAQATTRNQPQLHSGRSGSLSASQSVVKHEVPGLLLGRALWQGLCLFFPVGPASACLPHAPAHQQLR